MILGAMSDTHGNIELMLEVAGDMAGLFQAKVIFHLGDDYRDADELIAAGYRVRRVPGLWCAEYHDNHIPKRLVEEFDGIQVACAHADRDLRYPERAAGVVLTGHTHKAQVLLLGRSLYVNPGHLKSGSASRSERPSYAVIEIGRTEIRASIHETANGAVRDSVVVPRNKVG